MRSSKIKAKLRRNQPVLLTSLVLTDPSMYELTSLMGFDGIWMDLEHHAHSVETALAQLRAARVGTTDVMVRPAKGEFLRMGRILEAGAQGIMYPRCDNAEEAREVVSWAKFAPLGRRGFDGSNPDMPFCTMPIDEYVRQANEQTFVVVQIEDEKSLGNARAIAEVEGVDVLFFGPADFTILSGIPGQFDHPRVLEAMKNIADAVRRVGKHWGMPMPTMDRVRQAMDLGARFLCQGSDVGFIKNGLEALRRDFAPLGVTFDGRI